MFSVLEVAGALVTVEYQLFRVPNSEVVATTPLTVEVRVSVLLA
jgi:hypothetical protein